MFVTFLGFTPFWDYKPTKAWPADSPGVHTSDKILYLTTKNENQLKCLVTDGRIQNGLGQPKLHSFA